MENLSDINRRLREIYGLDPSTNYPKYRVVWSDEQLEARRGERNVFLGGIYLRTERFSEKVPKYPFIEARHVFEFFCPTDNPELLEGGKNYEPIYVFQDKNEDPLPVVWWAVEFLANVLERNEAPTIRDEEEEKQKEIREYFNILDEELPETTSRIVRGEGVVLNKTDFWGES